MRTIHDVPSLVKSERAILIGLLTPDMDAALFDVDLQEMQMLCTTAGAVVVKRMVQKRPHPESATYLGGGKIHELAREMAELSCTTLVIDAELSPSQVRNIEEVVEGKVVDRNQVILDIFAKHARTNEARIQVELAQLRTLYPRLTRAWTHFSQQVGGIGTRGPGEKQLEVDRRLVQKKIGDLQARLKKVESGGHTQRKSREDIYKVTLVGYTNVGKSSLLNALSGAKVLVENKLFATLDTATRRTYIPGVGTIIVSDTVGFIRKLPHHLVASFRSTLEVAREADLLLVMVDASCPWVDQQLATVESVLSELAADRIPRLLILNKDDLLTDPFERKKVELAYPSAVFVNAFDKQSVRALKERIAQCIADHRGESSMPSQTNSETEPPQH